MPCSASALYIFVLGAHSTVPPQRPKAELSKQHTVLCPYTLPHTGFPIVSDHWGHPTNASYREQWRVPVSRQLAVLGADVQRI